MSTSAKAVVRLKFTNQKQLTTMLSALKPELHASQTRRAKVKLEKEKCYLVVSVDAEDTVALRATLNAYLRWINSTIKVIEVLEHPNP